MGKFAIYYDKHKDKNRKQNYIDYNESCSIIKSIVHKYHNHDESNIEEDIMNISNDPQSNTTTNSTINQGTDCSEVLKGIKELNLFLEEEDKGNHITKLISYLDTEIKRVYLYYLDEELEIFKMMKVRLLEKKEYKSYSINCIAKEMKLIKNLLDEITSIMAYLILNMECLKQICLKIDRHLTPLYDKGSIALKYLRTKLELQNSDLSYMLSYNIIDEVCVLVDYLVVKLYDYTTYAEYDEKDEEEDDDKASIEINYFNNCNDNNLDKTSIVDQIGSFSQEDFLLSIGTSKEKKAYIKKEITNIKNTITSQLKVINVSKSFRIKYENNPVTIRYGFGTINYTNLSSGTQLEEDDENKMTQINSLIDEELIIKDFLTPRAFKEYINYCKNNLSKSNKINMILIFIHIIISTTFYIQIIFLPYEIENLKDLCNSLFSIHCGIIMSHFVYGYFLRFKKMYRITICISCLCFLIGQNLIHLPTYLNLGKDKGIIDIINFISKFIIGLGCGKLSDRKYIVTFSSRPLLKRNIKKYKLLTYIGYITGFGASGITYIFITNKYTKLNISHFSGLILIIYMLTFISFFTCPENPEFSIEKDENENLFLSRTLSISKRKIITHDESNLIKNANIVISKESQSFTFNNLNIIQQNIQRLITLERVKYRYIKKAFCTIFFLSFFNSFLPYYSIIQCIMFKKFIDYKFIGIFCFICLISYTINLTDFPKISMNQKHIVLFILYQVIFSCIIGLIHFDTIEFYSFSLVVSGLSICCSRLINKEINRLLKKIVPQDFNLCSFNSSLYMTLSESLSIIIAIITIRLSMSRNFTEGNEMEWSQLILNVIIMTYPFLLSLIIALMNYKYLEPRAIARIYKKNMYQ